MNEKPVYKAPICPYCRSKAVLIKGMDLFPKRKDLQNNWFWVCQPCDARVGTHSNSHFKKPLGTLANAELRRLRADTHRAFDPFWRKGPMKRFDREHAYIWLSKRLEIDIDDCHIALFDSEQCRKVIEICNTYRSLHF